MRYLQRSIKYFLSLCILYILMLYFFSYTSYVILTPGQKFHAMMSTPRGVFLLCAIFALAAAYPYFGFMRRFISGDLVRNREQIMTSFALQRMRLDHESEGRMTFVANNFMKRASMLFEDHVKVIQHPDGRLAVSGNRKAVAYVIYRLEVAIENAEQERASEGVNGGESVRVDEPRG